MKIWSVKQIIVAVIFYVFLVITLLSSNLGWDRIITIIACACGFIVALVWLLFYIADRKRARKDWENNNRLDENEDKQ